MNLIAFQERLSHAVTSKKQFINQKPIKITHQAESDQQEIHNINSFFLPITLILLSIIKIHLFSSKALLMFIVQSLKIPLTDKEKRLKDTTPSSQQYKI